MNPLKAILVILGMWLAPLSLPQGLFPTTTTTTSTTTTSTTLVLLPSTTVARSSSTVTPTTSVVVKDDVWWQLALCEDGGKNRTFNSFHGYFHFMLETWWGVGGTGEPQEHDYETQKHFAQKLQSIEGWWPWPGCKIKLGL